MAIRKNKKRIDPRYFLHETAYRDEGDEEKVDEGFTTNMPDNIPSTAQVMQQMAGEPDEEQGSFSTTGPDRQAALTTDDLFKLFSAGINPADLRDVDNNSLTPEMASILGRSASGAGY